MSSTPSYDISIIGAGPAGSACAITLARHAPGARFCLIDRFDHAGSPIGEALTPLARPVLEQLGLWQAFVADDRRAVYRSHAVWGQDALGGMEFMDFPLGEGWTLDRARFNRMLADRSRLAATEALDTVLSDISGGDGAWRLRVAGRDTEIRTGVVDATGRRSAVLRKLGHRPTKQDRMVAHLAFTRDQGPEPGVTVEACEYGWWYSAGLPRHRRVVALMTDADIARQVSARDPTEFEAHLRATRYLSEICPEPISNVVVHPAASQVYEPVAPDTIVPVGDAAAAHDPLSSYGILGAMRSGIYAAYAIGDMFGGKSGSLEKYRRFLRDDWRIYRRFWQDYYDRETRWPDASFWGRRHSQARNRRHEADTSFR